MRHKIAQIAESFGNKRMQAAQITRLLGGEEVFGRRIVDELNLEKCAREGFPLAMLQALHDKAGLSQDDVYSSIIPRRTVASDEKSPAAQPRRIQSRLARLAHLADLRARR
jgi:hypothetical protein